MDGKETAERSQSYILETTFFNLVLRLWSSGQNCWLQIQRSGFDFRRCQIFGEVAGLERGALTVVRITEELLGWKSRGSGLENRD
jgi:hypothetical protein